MKQATSLLGKITEVASSEVRKAEFEFPNENTNTNAGQPGRVGDNQRDDILAQPVRPRRARAFKLCEAGVEGGRGEGGRTSPDDLETCFGFGGEEQEKALVADRELLNPKSFRCLSCDSCNFKPELVA